MRACTLATAPKRAALPSMMRSRRSSTSRAPRPCSRRVAARAACCAAIEHRQVRGRAGVAGVRREVEQHHRDLALGAFGAAQRDQAVDARGEHLGALDADVHVAALVVRREGAGPVATGALRAGRGGAAAEHHRPGRAVELRDRDHDRGLDRQQAAVRSAPLLERLELDRLRGEVGHVERRQHLLGRARRRCRPGRRRARSRSARRPRRPWRGRPS